MEAGRLNFSKVLFFSTIILCLFFIGETNARPKPPKKTKAKPAPNLIKELMLLNKSDYSLMLKKPAQYKLQIIYTQVNRDSANNPSFTEHRYQVNNKTYFYPASIVKLPISLLALEKLNKLHLDSLNENSTMLTLADGGCQYTTLTDSSSCTGFPSIKNYIKRMMLVSDNKAFSRLYEFTGPDFIHDQLGEKGYSQSRITHRFDGWCSSADNKCSNPILFYSNSGELIYEQAKKCSSRGFPHPLRKVIVGRANIVNGRKVKRGKNFTSMNFIPLSEIDKMLKSVIMPQAIDNKNKFNINEKQREMMLAYMSMFPKESLCPIYDTAHFEDSHKKYFLLGNIHGITQNDSIRIFNVVGMSYGFLVDCAYIIDIKNNIEFFLTAAIYVNKNGVINDGSYEYKSIGFPFFSNFGKLIYEYEKSRKKTFLPNLKNSEFNINYKDWER
jgi:hypothetical protein